MQLSDVFLNLGEDRFSQLLRGISIGKLRTYQLFERLKFRLHLSKLNTENLRKAAPRLWERLGARDEEFATDLSQAVLVSHLDLIVAVLNFLGIPHEDGFFVKDLDAAPYLTEGWEARVYDKFQGEFPDALLLFYINHLGLELGKAETPFIPAAA
ncbi:MAG: hypothetical protein JWO80_4576 [Bryobacterales bacterium]|jgi:hypothetical protein|nr:hypothetical protein [Bryobacterales bacterium]